MLYRTGVCIAALTGILAVGLFFFGHAPQPVAAQEPAPTASGGRSGVSIAGCSELLVNGGFEVNDLGWGLFGAEAPPAYSTTPVFAGGQSMRLGIVDSANLAIINGARQTIFLPNSAASVVLSYHYLPVHEVAPGDDLQYLDIYDAVSGAKLSRLWSQLSNGQSWIFLQFDLTAFRGRQIRVEFGVRNDGGGGRTALFLDDVSLLSCDAGATPFVTPTPTTISLLPSPTFTPIFVTATPTPSITHTPTPIFTRTPLPTATPLPTGCVTSGFLQNGGFEGLLGDTDGWILGEDPVPPVLSSEKIEGARSLLMGNPPGAGTRNTVTYSSARQLVSLPFNASTAAITWNHQSRSQEVAALSPSRWQDRQELILLEPSLDTKRILYRNRENVLAWQEETVDLTAFLGQTFYVYFNVFNDGDGNRTWMFLDNVQLIVCFLNTTPPPITPTASLTPAPTQTPTSAVTGAGVESRGLDDPTIPASGTLVAVGVSTPLASRQLEATRTAAPLPEIERLSFWQRARLFFRTPQGRFTIFIVIVLAAIFIFRYLNGQRNAP